MNMRRPLFADRRVREALTLAYDFETPNQALAINCGNSLDTTPIQALYGTPGFTYFQTFTVEAVSIIPRACTGAGTGCPEATRVAVRFPSRPIKTGS